MLSNDINIMHAFKKYNLLSEEPRSNQNLFKKT